MDKSGRYYSGNMENPYGLKSEPGYMNIIVNKPDQSIYDANIKPKYQYHTEPPIQSLYINMNMITLIGISSGIAMLFILIFLIMTYENPTTEARDPETGDLLWYLDAGLDGYARVLEGEGPDEGMTYEKCRELEKQHRQRIKNHNERMTRENRPLGKIHLNWMDCKIKKIDKS